MGLNEFLEWLEHTPLSVAVSETSLFPAIESVHVLAIVLVVGSIFIIDLRLLGLASRDRPLPRLMTEVLPITWISFAAAVMSGSLLFSSAAVKYSGDVSFRLKFSVMALAGINMLYFHFVTYRGAKTWAEGALPISAKAAGAVSVILWIVTVALGRWIGFTTQA